MKKTNLSKIVKWGAVILMGIVGAYGELSKQKEQAEFDDLKDRVARLESNEYEEV